MEIFDYIGIAKIKISMQIQFNSIYDLADFSSEGQPTIKPEYVWKTLYAIYHAHYDIVDQHRYGFSSRIDGTIYKEGFYVIPCFLWCKKWKCGDRVMIWPRDFCGTTGNPCNNEPEDVPHNQWWIAKDFKPYFGIAKYMKETGNVWKQVENLELYTDVNEAIERAKELDKWLSIKKKVSEIQSRVENCVKCINDLEKKIADNPKNTLKKKEQYLEDRQRKTEKYAKLSEDMKKLEEISMDEKQFKKFDILSKETNN